MFQLSNSIELIADEREYESLIRASLEKFEITKETTALSRLDIHLPPAAEVSPEFGLVPHRAPLQERDQDSADVHRRGDRPDHEQGRWSPSF